ncbi:unnamed protein product [Prunus armeniaca]
MLLGVGGRVRWWVSRGSNCYDGWVAVWGCGLGMGFGSSRLLAWLDLYGQQWCLKSKPWRLLLIGADRIHPEFLRIRYGPCGFSEI